MNQHDNLKTAISVVYTGQHVTVNEMGSGFVFALAITLVEALDAATGVNQLLLTSEVRMALVAEFRGELGLRGTRGEGVPAGTLHGRIDVVGMNVSLHGGAPKRFRDW
jgi:hypothetical protein